MLTGIWGKPTTKDVQKWGKSPYPENVVKIHDAGRDNPALRKACVIALADYTKVAARHHGENAVETMFSLATMLDENGFLDAAVAKEAVDQVKELSHSILGRTESAQHISSVLHRYRLQGDGRGNPALTEQTDIAIYAIDAMFDIAPVDSIKAIGHCARPGMPETLRNRALEHLKTAAYFQPVLAWSAVKELNHLATVDNEAGALSVIKVLQDVDTPATVSVLVELSYHLRTPEASHAAAAAARTSCFAELGYEVMAEKHIKNPRAMAFVLDELSDLAGARIEQDPNYEASASVVNVLRSVLKPAHLLPLLECADVGIRDRIRNALKEPWGSNVASEVNDAVQSFELSLASVNTARLSLGGHRPPAAAAGQPSTPAL